ncbi:hypothetical protein [Shewanella sp. 10N.286.48.A6]|uniref:hypothetical protein n=1 Tax=Shewanella sp. 10N.286.48.A6 TaxID=1880833 RepID=UPI000C8444B8|nr:hypothetical protein [Shewanella sp. 10N.286.48.A6]PMI02838.1 hypothetical protein BCU55_04460 [Shewanella sp. 10N.286.48.A6]
MRVKLGFKSDVAMFNLLLLTKLFYIFFAEYIYSMLTRLGDTPKYLSSSIEVNLRALYSSTQLMKTTGGILGYLPAPLYHVPLCLLSWYGLVFLYKQLSINGIVYRETDRIKFYIVFSLPSVAVWSSIHSKEAVGVFFASVLSTLIIKFSSREKFNFDKFYVLIVLFSGYLLLTFKPQYFISLFSILLYFLLSRRFSYIWAFCVLFLGLTIQLYLLYYFQPLVDMYALQMHAHFDSAMAKSTRENIFLNDWDFYKNAPSGLLVAFIGPTISESVTSPPKFLAFAESLILVVILLPIFLHQAGRFLVLKINVNHLAIILLLIFWLLFVHYPFGIFNPGSALRYRVNFLPFLVTSMFVISSRYSSKNIKKTKK